MARNGNACATIEPVAKVSDPTTQKRNSFNVDRSSKVIADVTEPSNADIAAPASASLTGVAPPRPDRAHGVHDERRDQCAGHREPHVPSQGLYAEDADRHDDRERCTGVDAEDPRVGQRIAGDPLHHRAGQPESHSGEQAGRSTRES